MQDPNAPDTSLMQCNGISALLISRVRCKNALNAKCEPMFLGFDFLFVQGKLRNPGNYYPLPFRLGDQRTVGPLCVKVWLGKNRPLLIWWISNARPVVISLSQWLIVHLINIG